MPLFQFVRGTGSPPGGIEATFVYNGLTLGDRSSLERYRITQVSGLDDADIRDSRDLWSTQHGEVANLAFYGGRTISIRGVIEAGDMFKVRDMQEDLRAAFASLTEMPLYINTPNNAYNVMFEKVRKSAPIQMSEQPTNRPMREFQITLRSSDPWMVAQSLTTTTIGSSGGSTTINNTGNFNASPVIRFNGVMTNPSVTIGSYTVTTIMSVTGTNWVEIDVHARTVLDNNGASKYGSISSTTVWPLILPGSNSVSATWSSGSGGDAVDVKWRPTWM